MTSPSEAPGEATAECLPLPLTDPAWPTVVIVGGGFAGIDLVRNLPDRGVNIVVVDRHNYHTFQPLLYQVATGGLDAGSIAYPLRKVFKGKRNVIFRMAEMLAVSPDEKKILTSIGEIHYDYLVVAVGSTTNFFGNGSAERYCFPLKSVPNAIDLRSAILLSLEKALSTTDSRERARYTTFVIVGGGATGVELAGALSELQKVVIPNDYSEIAPGEFRVILVEGGPRLLPGMSEKSSSGALRALQKMGIEVLLNVHVKTYDGEVAILSDGGEIRSDTVVWAAGVRGKVIEGIPDEVVHPSKRIKVDPYNRIEGFQDIFAIGDIAIHVSDETPRGLPQVAPVAKQQGEHLAKNLLRLFNGKDLLPFKYFDKGALAVIGRNKAVADLPGIILRGFIAWLAWGVVHILYLVGFRNKVITMLDWMWNYFTYDRFVRLILRPVKRPPKNVPTRT